MMTVILRGEQRCDLTKIRVVSEMLYPPEYPIGGMKPVEEVVEKSRRWLLFLCLLSHRSKSVLKRT